MPRSLSALALLVVLLAAPCALAFAPGHDPGDELQPKAPWVSGSEAPGGTSAPEGEPAAANASAAVRFPRAPAPRPAPVTPRSQDGQDAPKPAPSQDPSQDERKTFEVPPVEVVGDEYEDDELVGPYNQPRWSTDRIFPTTRVYVKPEGEQELEYWMRIEEPRHGETRIRDYYEYELGLPNRFQLDLYLVADHTGEWEPGAINQQMIEGRYAFADWGELWGNPTAYLEYIHRNGDDPESIEGKLLLADTLSPGWHWASNLSCEQEVSGDRERELELTAGVSHTIIDEKFSMGIEGKADQIDQQGSRSDNTHEFEIGPSMRWEPAEHTSIQFAPLAGIGPDSPQYELFLILGWEF